MGTGTTIIDRTAAPIGDHLGDASTLHPWLADLGTLIAGGGVGNVEDDLAVLAALADTGSTALTVLLDRTAPEIVRARAFQRVAAGLLAAPSTSSS